MKLAIITAVHGRVELTRIVYERLRRTIEVLPFDVVVCVAGDERKHLELAGEYEWDWITTPNHWVSKKFTNALWMAKQHAPDYVMTIGSDDLIHPQLFEYYSEWLDMDCIGVNQMHFYEAATHRMKLFTGYETPQTMGAGRMYSSTLLDDLDWDLWRIPANHGLDTQASRLIDLIGVEETLIDAPALICDVKTDTNINTYASIPGIEIDPEVIHTYLDGLYFDADYFNFKKTTSSC